MQWVEQMPARGQIIRTRVSFYHHYGIFVDEQTVYQFGMPDNVHTPPDQVKVLTTDVYTFLHGGTLEVGIPDRQERKSLRPVEEIIACAHARLGEGGYDFLHNNCEHFVNDCAFGQPRSAFLDEVRVKLRRKLGKVKGRL